MHTTFVQDKVQKTFGRFQLEAPRAYRCKQILGLCHNEMCLVQYEEAKNNGQFDMIEMQLEKQQEKSHRTRTATSQEQ